MSPRLVQTPATGTRCVRWVGDRLRFALREADGRAFPAGWQARLRTNLGRAGVLRREIITAVESRRPPTLSSWRDVPMTWDGREWAVELPLAEVGFFKAKAYAVDERDWQHWPEGADFGVNVQPAWCRTGNTIYCAFPRMFGPNPAARVTVPSPLDAEVARLDAAGYTVIPPSGKFRDLIGALPHIIDTLGCRILQLLPVNPTPTTYARFGRFGSPYACEDFLAIDPALVEFDRRTTGLDQFRELAHAVHARGGRLFLDMVINHTGWGSTLQERRPEWFHRDAGGTFVSPGAWGTIWEDLVELDHRHAALRRELGEAFAEWCRRGVDGFRCDAGYKVPLPVWQYIIARVRQEFPDAVFLLEGLGGAWADTEALLTEGGMQWAYSELFQNYSGAEVARYLDYALAQSAQSGLFVHYSETHDNPRLAAKGRAWSRLRNRLCALTSVSGGFGFTNGVEWLATERVNVHSNRGLAWGSPDNLVDELGRLNRLLAGHPCFFDGARLERLSPPASPVYALLRESADGRDAVLVLVNTDAEQAHSLALEGRRLAQAGLLAPSATTFAGVDLLNQPLPELQCQADGRAVFTLPAAGGFCLAPAPEPQGMAGEAYRRHRAQAAFALQALSQSLPAEQLGRLDTAELAAWVERDAAGLLGAVANLPADAAPGEMPAALRAAVAGYPRVVRWELPDRQRVTPVPPGHWLLVQDQTPFRVVLRVAGETRERWLESTPVAQGHVAALPPPGAGDETDRPKDAEMELDRYGDGDRRVTASLRFLAPEPLLQPASGAASNHQCPDTRIALLTNGRGGMARMAVDLGAIRSKYDCLLAANLDPRVPVDRHVFAKRVRVWVNADGFLSPLDADNLAAFEAGPPARWRFVANAGDGRGAEIHLTAAMMAGRNTTVLRFHRPATPPGQGRALPPGADVRLTVRVDLEDRNFHWETKHNGGADHHFAAHTKPLEAGIGFAFAPAAERRLRVWSTAGRYHPQAEWCFNLAHPVEASRGQEGSGDAFSPGWFELPLAKGAEIVIVVSAEAAEPTAAELAAAFDEVDGRAKLPRSRGSDALSADSIGSAGASPHQTTPPIRDASAPPTEAQFTSDTFAAALTRAASAFVVRRCDAQTVIAGYPWFLDWGRDTLIAARGLLAAGWVAEVRGILHTFAAFEKDGTLPNAIHGDDTSNRDTSDAPLWFGLACEAFAAVAGTAALTGTRGESGDRPLAEVLRAIAAGYLRGTPNGVRVDAGSGLVFSPAHFTWMDTNHPAATPRAGYPVEIQALWIRLLRQLERLGAPPAGEPWNALAERAAASFQRLFWLEEKGWLADVLLAEPGEPATVAEPQDALRGNALLPVCLGLVSGERARRMVAAAGRWLVVPGALRSLAPLPVSPPLPVPGPHGGLLNDPAHPYWGRYEGDEDTRRKPAYHNGTAWPWTLPHFCEALARAWDFAPSAVAAAKAYLGSMDRLLAEGCVGHLPEIVDGDAPHEQRGCDAQAWSVTEALRVWRLLEDADNRATTP